MTGGSILCRSSSGTPAIRKIFWRNWRRSSDETTDEWVLGKRPQVVLKCAGSQDPDTVRQAVQQRFPDQEVLVVSAAALGDGPEGLYARLALAKHLYPDWYGDVDLDTVAAELGITDIPVYF